MNVNPYGVKLITIKRDALFGGVRSGPGAKFGWKGVAVVAQR